MEQQTPQRALRKYYIMQGANYWLQNAYGYTKKVEEAGVFTLQDMIDNNFNLDRCKLVLV